MASTFTGAATAQRPQRLFLIPIGQENTHQRTIDGLLPADVVPSASTSALLPCWGVTDGNYLAKNKVRAQAGDIFALIRAQHKGQSAYVHRLAVVEKLVRDPSACAELYKHPHDYNMGGRKVSSVPFTWIIKFKAIMPVKWDKQAFLAKLGIPAHDPILSARPAVMAHQKNAAQAAQVLQECNAVLGLPSNMQQSSGSGPSPPATMLQSNSCGHYHHNGAPLTTIGKTAHTPKPVPKRPHLELPNNEQNAQQTSAPPSKRNKCMPSPASIHQHVHDKDQALTDPQTDQDHDHGLHINQHLEHTFHAGSHHRPCKATHVTSRKLKYQALTTEELQGKLGRLRWVLQTCVNSLGDGGQKIMAECNQVEDELEFRMAEEQSKQQGSRPDHSNSLADPGSPSAPAPAQPACHGNSTVDLSGQGPQVQDVAMVEPQSETQAVSFAQAQSTQSEAEEASQALSGKVQADAAPVQESHYAGVIAAPAAIMYAQRSIIAGLIYHFAATKGPSWLAQ